MPRQHKGTEEKWVGGKLQFFRPYCDKDARAWKERELKSCAAATQGTVWNQSALVPAEKKHIALSRRVYYEV